MSISQASKFYIRAVSALQHYCVIGEFNNIKTTSGSNCKEKTQACGRSYHLSQTTSLGSVSKLDPYLLLGLKTSKIKLESCEKLCQLFSSCFINFSCQVERAIISFLSFGGFYLL